MGCPCKREKRFSMLVVSLCEVDMCCREKECVVQQEAKRVVGSWCRCVDISMHLPGDETILANDESGGDSIDREATLNGAILILSYRVCKPETCENISPRNSGTPTHPPAHPRKHQRLLAITSRVCRIITGFSEN